MPLYAGYCDNCKDYVFTNWGVKKCPKCNNKIIQSKVKVIKNISSLL